MDLLPGDHRPPREETRRCTVMGPPGCGGRDRARRAPRSRDRRSAGIGRPGCAAVSRRERGRHQGSFHPHRDPLPGQRRADTDLLVGQADAAGGVDGAVHLDHRACPVGSGEGPAGRAPLAASRASSATPSWEGTVLIRVPSSSTCRLIASAQKVICRPDKAGPSQTCCPPIYTFPEAGTTRSTSTAGWPAPAAVAGVGAISVGKLGAGSGPGAGGFGWPVPAHSWPGCAAPAARTRA